MNNEITDNDVVLSVRIVSKCFEMCDKTVGWKIL